MNASDVRTFEELSFLALEVPSHYVQKPWLRQESFTVCLLTKDHVFYVTRVVSNFL